MKSVKTKKSRSLYILVILLVLGLVYFGQSILQREEKKVQTDQKQADNREELPVKELIEKADIKDVKVTVDFGNGKIFSKEIPPQTAFEALKTLAAQEGWEVKTKE